MRLCGEKHCDMEANLVVSKIPVWESQTDAFGGGGSHLMTRVLVIQYIILLVFCPFVKRDAIAFGSHWLYNTFHLPIWLIQLRSYQGLHLLGNLFCCWSCTDREDILVFNFCMLTCNEKLLLSKSYFNLGLLFCQVVNQK